MLDQIDKGRADEKTETCCCCGGCDTNGPEAAVTDGAGTLSVKILGSGCPRCSELEAATRSALQKLGLAAVVEHVTDFSRIAAYGVMATPALVIDGKVVSYGRVLRVEEIVKMLQKIR